MCEESNGIIEHSYIWENRFFLSVTSVDTEMVLYDSYTILKVYDRKCAYKIKIWVPIK